MEDVGNFIQTIISDGNKKSRAIINQANQDAEKILREAEQAENEFVKSNVDDITKENEERLVLAKNSTVFKLNKLILKEKNVLINRVFELVLDKFKRLDDNKYRAFLESALKYAENGDEINYSSRKDDSKRISSLKIFKEKNLSLGKELKDISGGIIISNKVCDKDFSFEGLIKEKKENSIKQVAQSLF
ncbi:MAG: hypothetical protein IKQ31_01920 [Clostridia bacterium]|nr:hypothetical protein [Clostridia bacterium]